MHRWRQRLPIFKESHQHLGYLFFRCISLPVTDYFPWCVSTMGISNAKVAAIATPLISTKLKHRLHILPKKGASRAILSVQTLEDSRNPFKDFLQPEFVISVWAEFEKHHTASPKWLFHEHNTVAPSHWWPWGRCQRLFFFNWFFAHFAFGC